MDEIDAALDFKNVSIVANYIKERTKNAQFVIISLRLVRHVFTVAIFCSKVFWSHLTNVFHLFLVPILSGIS